MTNEQTNTHASADCCADRHSDTTGDGARPGPAASTHAECRGCRARAHHRDAGDHATAARLADSAEGTHAHAALAHEHAAEAHASADHHARSGDPDVAAAPPGRPGGRTATHDAARASEHALCASRDAAVREPQQGSEPGHGHARDACTHADDAERCRAREHAATTKTRLRTELAGKHDERLADEEQAAEADERLPDLAPLTRLRDAEQERADDADAEARHHAGHACSHHGDAERHHRAAANEHHATATPAGS